MNLEKYISGIKTSMSPNKDRTVEYLMKYDLKNYFSEDVPEDEREKRKSLLEKKVENSFEKYGDEISGIARKGVSKTSMMLAIINDVYAYVSKVPIANVTGLSYTLFVVKSIAEVPAMYRYMKKSHDWYGALTHYLMKPVNYLLPVVGAAIESGSFERMVRRRARNDARNAFVKEVGNYIPFEKRMSKTMRTPLKEVVKMHVRKAA